MICIGLIQRAVGLKGEFVVQPYTDSLDFFKKNAELFLSEDRKLIVTSFYLDKKGKIKITLDGIDNRTKADTLVKNFLYIRRSDLPLLGCDEFYFEDLKNLIVVDENNKELGVVQGVFDYGGGVFLDIFISEINKTATVQFNRESIIFVDLYNKKINISKEKMIF